MTALLRITSAVREYNVTNYIEGTSLLPESAFLLSL
jgi:hypothetical protein